MSRLTAFSVFWAIRADSRPLLRFSKGNLRQFTAEMIPFSLVLMAVGLAALPANLPGALAQQPPASASRLDTDAPPSEAPFSIRHDETGWWLVSPQGRKFFSLGVCCVGQGASRDSFDPENPGYAAWQHYASPAAWAKATRDRLREWGFTTLGGWSEFETLRDSPSVPEQPVSGSTGYRPVPSGYQPHGTGAVIEVKRGGGSARGTLRGSGRQVADRSGQVARATHSETDVQPQPLYLTPVPHIGSTAGAPWWDMWDPKNLRRMETVAREQILPLRDDPRLLGYYSDNELGWWNATLWKMTLEQPSSSGQRQRLVRLLREVYQDDWDKLLQDFEPEHASSWRQLRRGGMLFMKSGGNGIHTMRRFLGLLADRYYQLMRDLIRQCDRRALFLGDRYQSFYYPEVARAAGRYVDAVSSNLNASWNDGTFLRSYLDTLHALTGKPILVSEFYAAAADNRSGNRNSSGVFPVVATQAERANAARSTLLALLRLPYVLGADWFQFTDEPTHGRDDGENLNFGLVDIHDRPYEELTAMFTSLDAEQLKAQRAPARLDASSGVPPAPPDPFADFTPTHALKHWDRERGFVKPTSTFPLGDLYLCWEPDALCLGLYALDIVEAAYYRGGAVPKRDRALWTVRVGGREIVHARLGAGREPLVNEPRVRIENLSGVDLNVRNIAALELPAPLCGTDQFKPGDTIALDCTLLTHCAAYRMEWKGTFRLRE